MTIIDLNYIKEKDPERFEWFMDYLGNVTCESLERIVKSYKNEIRFNKDIMLDKISYVKMVEREESMEERVKEFERKLEEAFY